ncbi:hypothetical protein B6U96_00120 [Archaeoglobales archaeon ex4484_92]|nr:MAG: hypothetical protein B6U96_00120 [Archaeoglobales archaeon ex4484_92]
MEVFQVVDSNEPLRPIKKLKRLDIDKVYLLIDHHSRKIILWKGIKAPKKEIFLGATASRRVRMEKGPLFRVIPIDSEKSMTLEEVSKLVKIGYSSPLRTSITTIETESIKRITIEERKKTLQPVRRNKTEEKFLIFGGLLIDNDGVVGKIINGYFAFKKESM